MNILNKYVKKIILSIETVLFVTVCLVVGSFIGFIAISALIAVLKYG